MVLRVGDILGFAERAKTGDAMVYGRGDHPPRDLVRAMQPFIASGVLNPCQKRDGGSILYMVQRGSGSLGAPMRARRGMVRRKRVPKSSLSQVFDCLTRAVRRGEACPTNEELAARCGLSGKLAASYRMRKLVAMGRIAVDDRSPFGRRVVTLLVGPLAGKATVEAAL